MNYRTASSFYRSIETELGVLRSIFLSPGGFFVHAESYASPAERMASMNRLLRVSGLQLSSAAQGLYAPCNCCFGACIPENEIGTRAVEFTGFSGQPVFLHTGGYFGHVIVPSTRRCIRQRLVSKPIRKPLPAPWQYVSRSI